MNNEQNQIHSAMITFKILNARLGCAKEVISSITKPNFRIKFIVRNNKKIEKGIKYSKTIIPLKDSLMFFDKDEIHFDNIDLDTDTILISFQTLEKYNLKTEYTSIKIHLKDLDKAKEIDVVWTLAKQSFINITYQINMRTLFKLPMTSENADVDIGSIDTIPHDMTSKSEYNDLGIITTGFDDEKIKPHHANKTPSLFSAAKARFSLKSTRKSIDLFKSLDIVPIELKKGNKTIVSEHSMNRSPSYEILESNYHMNDTDSIYSCDYISKLNYEEIDYDTFCHCVFISGLNKNNTELIPQSEEYPSPCQHKECSILSAFQSSILHHYQNEKKTSKHLEISDLTANLCFPLGIKLCFHANNKITSPKSYKTFLNVIKNEKGDNFYIVTLHYFRIMSVEDFDKFYKLNPLKEYTKFLNYDKNNYDETKFTSNLKIISDFIGNETVLIPESITLVSRFPFINQMAYCLRTLITFEPNEMNSMISHLINEIPIPNKMKKIMFYLPYNPIPIELASPFMPNISNSYHRVIFDYLSIENIIFIFNLILLEQKVLFIENNYQILSGISLAFISFIYPFNWMNTYIPVLSLISVQFLQSIIPFIMGTDEFLFKYSIINEYIEENQKNVYINVKTNTIFLSPSLKKKVSKKQILKELDIPELPEKIVSFLTGKLKDIKKHLNDKIPIENIEEQIKEAFCETMARLIGDYKINMFITENDTPLFNSECYLDSKNKEDRQFYAEMIQTQLFMQFLFNEKQISCKATRKLNEFKTKYGVLYDNILVDTVYFKTVNQAFLQSKKEKKDKKNHKNNSKVNSPNILRTSSKSKIQALSPSSILSSNNKNNSTDNTIKKDLSTSQDEVNKPKNCILLSPYFINDPMIYTDKTKIEAFISNQCKLRLNNNTQDISVYLNAFLIEDTKQYAFDKITDSYRRYFPNEHSFISKTNSRKFNRSTLKKRSLSSSCLNNKTKGLRETKILSELFFNLCISETKENIAQYDIIPLLNSEDNRHFFSNLIKQPDYDHEDAEQASFAGLDNDDYPSKMLNLFCFSELSKYIKLALSYLTENEYYTCKHLTAACFTYFKIVNKKRIFIYEEYTNLFQLCKIWLEEDFWINWFLDNIDNETQNDNSDIQSHHNPIIISKRLIRLENIMIKLHLKKEFIKNVIINQIATKYFNEDCLIQFKEGFNQRTYLL